MPMLRTNFLSKLFFALPLGFVVAAACSTDEPSGQPADAGVDAAAEDGSGFDIPDGSTKVGDFDGASCATSTSAAQFTPLDIVVALDKSGSMLADNKWGQVTLALKTFLSNRNLTALSVGLQFFPARRLCSVDAYGRLAVPISELPSQSQALVTALNLEQPIGGTPMAPALQGVLNAAKVQAVAHPDHSVVVLLATDGVPDSDCANGADGVTNDISGVERVATAAANGNPKIPTFVIGVGNTLTELNRIAAAGGTGSAILLDSTKDVLKDFSEALTQIRRRSLSCQFPIPRPVSGSVDFTKVNVQAGSEIEKTSTIPFVEKATDCPRNGRGWHYDNPAAPTKISLCNDTCANLTEQPSARVDIVFGCTTVTTVR